MPEAISDDSSVFLRQGARLAPAVDADACLVWIKHLAFLAEVYQHKERLHMM